MYMWKTVLCILLACVCFCGMFTKNIVTAHSLQQIEPHHIRFASRDLNMVSNLDSYTIDAWPLEISNDEIVTIDFSSSNPQDSDWIGVYSPYSVDITTTTPAKYAFCNEDPDYLTTGMGSLHFNMTNLRSDLAFYYFSNGTHFPVMEAIAPRVNYSDPNQPLRARITATGNIDELMLSWSSSDSVEPELRWGIHSGAYTHHVTATTIRLTQSQMLAAPAATIGWHDLGLIHRAIFTGMASLAGTKVYYLFGDAATDNWSTEHVLYVPPLPGQQPPTRPTTIVIFQDLGTGSLDDAYTKKDKGRPPVNTTMMISADIANGLVDAVFHGGDISYADGYLTTWDFFLDMISPMASSVLYLTTVGNHESDCPGTASIFDGNDSGGECGVVSGELIPMPPPATLDEPWWSYDVGLIHIVGMSTEHDYTVGSNQYRWLEADLAAVDRSITPWVLFSGHRAMYINSDSNYDYRSDVPVMEKLIEHIEPLLFEYEVNFAFWGHNHAVQRMSAVYQMKAVQRSTVVDDGDGGIAHAYYNPQATVHYVMGTGGATLDYNAIIPYPDWNEEVMSRWGYARVRSMNASVLDIEWIDSGDGLVYDRIIISRDNPDENWRQGNSRSDNAWEALGTSAQIAIVVVGVTVIVLCGVAIAYYLRNRRVIQKAQHNDASWTEIVHSPQSQGHVEHNPLV